MLFQRRSHSPPVLPTTLSKGPMQQQQQKRKRPPPPFLPAAALDRRWRWWHILSLVILLIAFAEVLLIFTGSVVFHWQRAPIRIAIRQFPNVTYQPLDTSAVFPGSDWRNSTSVYHITKEFGPATMGGMGTILTSMTAEQQKTGLANVNVVMPFYSFMRKKQKGVKLEKYADLVIHIPSRTRRAAESPSLLHQNNQSATTTYTTLSSVRVPAMGQEENDENEENAPTALPPPTAPLSSSSSSSSAAMQDTALTETIEFRVTRWKYALSTPPAAINETSWYIDDGGHNVTLAPGERRPPLKREQVTVYLIGPATQAPFNAAFRARTIVDIYSTPKELPQEWKDQYFLKAAAAFLSFQASTASHDTSLFAPQHDALHSVDVVHIHGATNAYLAHYLQDGTLWNSALPRPAIVYTMHDYLDELQYTNTVDNVNTFDAYPPITDLAPVLGHRMFMSSLAIDLADVVTFVSSSMAAQIVQGDLDFYLKELVMDSLLEKARNRRFFGISNGLDFSHADPFHSKRLTRAKIVYPLSALDEAMDTRESDMTVAHQKDRAKRWLVRKGFLQEGDQSRPLVLYVGRFQYNKGLDAFPRAIEAFARHNLTFVIIGQPNNYPLDKVLGWQQQYPNTVRLVTTQKEQKQWLIYARAAADAVFVPSLTESFGLVAGEGLLFGAPVLSTGVGGLAEFLVDRPNVPETRISATNPVTHNAYLFDVGDDDAMDLAIDDLAMDLHALRKQKDARESFVRHMIQSAIALQWARDHHHAKGPVYEYLRAYAIAIDHQHQKGPTAQKNQAPLMLR
ncbi:hypothetical protein BC940DRAFT_288372 [Gongronella butleri]|nr:hypothetical protein BC940DRAFT_288372 [Gongronella butleri]